MRAISAATKNEARTIRPAIVARSVNSEANEGGSIMGKVYDLPANP
jgi:hypothetical protein